MKQCRQISLEPRIYDVNVKINLTISHELIPTLIPQKSLLAIQKINTPQGKIQDPNPYYATEEIEDITQLANKVEFTEDFWNSYLDVLKSRPIPGRKKGHLPPYSYETPENDFYTIGGKIEGKKVFLKIYIPPHGFETTNEGLIRDAEAGLINFSLVSWTEDVTETDENGIIKSIKAVRSVKGERNDRVEIGMGAMHQKVNKKEINLLNILKILKKDEFDIEELTPHLNTEPIKYNPYPNEHAARIRNPGDFEKDSFRRINIKKGIDAIIGRLKGKKTTSTQAYRFNAKIYTAAEAKKWLKDHNITYISFEAATGGKSEKTEVYIMEKTVYSDIVKNLCNHLENGQVSRNQIAQDLKIEVATEEMKTAVKQLAEIKKLTGENPIETIKQLQENEKSVAQDKYDNMREKLMTAEFGPEKIGEEINLKRSAAEPHVSKKIQEEKILKEQIEKAKLNPVVKNISFQNADINSEINDITGIKVNTGNTYRKETIKA